MFKRNNVISNKIAPCVPLQSKTWSWNGVYQQVGSDEILRYCVSFGGVNRAVEFDSYVDSSVKLGPAPLAARE